MPETSDIYWMACTRSAHIRQTPTPITNSVIPEKPPISRLLGIVCWKFSLVDMVGLLPLGAPV